MACNALYLDGSDFSTLQVTSYMPASLVTFVNQFPTCAHVLESALAQLPDTQKASAVLPCKISALRQRAPDSA